MLKLYFQKIKKNKGFVILFAVTLASIILAIALGISNVALDEANFSTSVKDSDNAFYAGDTGAECALYYDRSNINQFPLGGPATSITCANNTTTPSYTGTATTGNYSFTIGNLGGTALGCAKVSVAKDDSSGTLLSTVDAKGDNLGSPSCNSTNTALVERELQLTVYGSAVVNGACGTAQPNTCTAGSPDNEVNGSTSYSWTCDGYNGGSTASCTLGKAATFSQNGASETTSGGYTIDKFTGGSNLSFTVAGGSGSVDYLIVGGGGSGGSSTGGSGGAGGGGAGGVISGSTTLSPGTYTITVGSGGVGVAALQTQGNSGGLSTFDGFTALGGGGGGAATSGALSHGLSGGSGGGAGYNVYQPSTIGTGTAGQGNNGGQNDAGLNGPGTGPDGGGGGGGGSVGGTSTTNGTGGIGGSGVASSISGSPMTYGAGGTGGSFNNQTLHADGGANTGNGGGGTYAQYAGQPSGAGGSGIVIIRHL